MSETPHYEQSKVKSSVTGHNRGLRMWPWLLHSQVLTWLLFSNELQPWLLSEYIFFSSKPPCLTCLHLLLRVSIHSYRLESDHVPFKAKFEGYFF